MNGTHHIDDSHSNWLFVHWDMSQSIKIAADIVICHMTITTNLVSL